MRSPDQRRKVLTLLVAALVLVALWWVQAQGETPDPVGDDRAGSARPSGGSPSDASSGHDYTSTATPSTEPGPATSSAPSGGVDPDSGLPVVRAADLPDEARDVLRRIDEGGPFKYPDDDGGIFENREELLPDHPLGYYREYTVESAPRDRGPMRIVTGAGGEAYWTADHYQSFARIAG